MATTNSGEKFTFTFKVGSGSAAALTGVTSLSVGAIEQEGIDSFAIGDTSRIQRPSELPDFGSLSFELLFDNANTVHKLIRTASSDSSTVELVATDSEDNETITAVGFITSFEIGGVEVGSNVTASVEMKVNTLTFEDVGGA